MILNKKRIIRERYPGGCKYDCFYFLMNCYLMCGFIIPCSV